MKNLKQKLLIAGAMFTILLLAAATVQAQTDDYRTIRGAVYKDVNGDGKCVNTGVEGEEPVPGVDILFVSSDKKTTVTLYSGDNGTYGLAGAGESIWEVTARPDAAKWVVTSKNPLFVPVVSETPVQTDINFCVAAFGTAGVGTGSANAVIVLPLLLPESGAAAANNSLPTMLLLTAVAGLILFATGAGIEWRRRANNS